MQLVDNNYILYIGDFDFRNKNVQSFLVKNNRKIFKKLGFKVAYIGINALSSFGKNSCFEEVTTADGDYYLELSNTLSFSGIKYIKKVSKIIESFFMKINAAGKICYVITYQSPSYSIVLRSIVKYCKNNGIPYIVNCADLPTFILQPFYRRIIMKLNWDFMHYINKKYNDGVIAVTDYIKEFYNCNDVRSVVIPPLFDIDSNCHVLQTAFDVVTFVYAGMPFKISGKEASPKGMKDRLDYIIDLFIDFASKKVKFQFLIIGIQMEDYLIGVPRHRKSIEKNSQIVFLGRKSHEDTLNYVVKADFTINYRDDNLMTKAGFSTKIVESISLGTPVVINDIGDVFKYVEKGLSAFQLVGNKEEDIKIIEELCLLSAGERRSIKEKVKELKLFDWTQYVDEMGAFLQRVSDEGKS